MKNKKLITILALTGVVANLGLATAFAQAVNTSGTQVIGCNIDGEYTLKAPAAITFETGRTTNFISEPDAPAILVVGSLLTEEEDTDNYNANASYIIVTDNRGYDAGGEPEDYCGAGFSLSVGSNGLRLDGIDGFDYDIQLGLGEATTWSEDKETPFSSPTTLLDLINQDSASNYESINENSGSLDLITSDEAFSGDVYLELSNTLYAIGSADVVRNAAAGFGRGTTPVTEFSTWGHVGAIPTGSYTGTITFTLT